MMGLPDKENQGIIPKAFEHVYGFIDDQSNVEKRFLVRCSYVEIYNEEIRDLLGPDPNTKLELKENKEKGVFVKDLTILTVKSIQEIERVMQQGNSLRKVGQTAMNDTSSRSHSLFTIYFETAETVRKSTESTWVIVVILIRFVRHCTPNQFISYMLLLSPFRSKESKDSRLASSIWST